MMINRNKDGQGGFTILEVVISVAIFGIGILAVAQMEILATRGNTSAGNISDGAILVQDVIETIVTAPYDDPLRLVDENGDNTIDADDPDTGADADFTVTINNHIVSWNVLEETPHNNTKTIQVIVESDVPGGTKTAVFDFIRAQLTS